jgi:hypothetical protein
MSNQAKDQVVSFGLTLPQKLLYVLAPTLFSLVIILMGPALKGWVGTMLLIILGTVLGLFTFFVSAGWVYKLEITPTEIVLTDRRQPIRVPLDRVGMLVQNGGFPFPTLWLVLRGASVGTDIPETGIDPRTRELIEAYQRRNPGKKLTVVPIPGGYLRSVRGFAEELKRRVPPIQIDERLRK